MNDAHPDANNTHACTTTVYLRVVTAADTVAWMRSLLYRDPPGAFVDKMVLHRLAGVDIDEQVAAFHRQACERWLPKYDAAAASNVTPAPAPASDIPEEA